MNALDIALQLASAGLPVFSCQGNKGPSIARKDGGRGYLDATTDRARIEYLFNRKTAVLVGVPTGAVSGFDVLDVDPKHGGHVWEAANLHRIPETRMHQTQSGGRHYLFQHVPGVRNLVGNVKKKRKIGDGIDVRGDGGYVVHPPSPGYQIISDAPIAPWPEWLLQPGLLFSPIIEKPSEPAGDPSAPVSDRLLDAIVNGAVRRVRNAPDGAKHETLRNEARLLGGIAERAELSNADIARRLLDALDGRGVKDWVSARETAMWGAREGRAAPLALPQEAVKPADPRRRETAQLAFRLLRRRIRGADIIQQLAIQNATRSEPLPDHQLRETLAWAAAQHSKGNQHAR